MQTSTSDAFITVKLLRLAKASLGACSSFTYTLAYALFLVLTKPATSLLIWKKMKYRMKELVLLNKIVAIDFD